MLKRSHGTRPCAMDLMTKIAANMDFGIGLAKYLKNTSIFYLPNMETATSCLSNIRAKLASMSISPPPCTNMLPEGLVANASMCAGIVSIKDWIEKVGSTGELDTACDADLSPLFRCNWCNLAGQRVSSMLQSLQPNNSTKCFYYAILYAAGIVNRYGPEDTRASACMLGLTLAKTATESWSQELILKIVLASLGIIIGILVIWGFIIFFQKRKREREQIALHQEYVRGVKAKVLPSTGAKWFQVDELDRATNGFSQKNLIGQGGYGVVYKGTLLDGTVVAVKQLYDLDLNGDDQEFTNEAEIISKIRHRNLLALRGYCVTSDAVKGNRRYLLYYFTSNGSLNEHLFEHDQPNSSDRQLLSWPLRKSIIIDVAKGLAYLHNDIRPAIYHRDIKSTNILLDSNMRAKVADFGLARQTTKGEFNVTTRIVGTFGYLAPEYALYGQLTEKSDVYSFGIIILEIISGRKALDASDSSTILITDWALELVKLGKIEEVVDEKMRGDGPKEVMERFVLIGILCAHVRVALRPNISDALKMLEGDIEIPRLPDRPMPLSHASYRPNSVMSSASVGVSSGKSSARSSISTTSNSRTSISGTM